MPPKQEKSIDSLEPGGYPKSHEQWKSQQAEGVTLKLPSGEAPLEPVKKEKAIGQLNIPSAKGSNTRRSTEPCLQSNFSYREPVGE